MTDKKSMPIVAIGPDDRDYVLFLQESSLMAQPLDATTRNRHASHILSSIVDHHRSETLAVREPDRLRNGSVQLVGQRARLAAGGCHDRQARLIVRRVFDFVSEPVRDRSPVRTPRQRAALL